MSNALFDKYLAKKAEIEAAQAGLKEKQGESRDLLRQILTADGKGPHEVGGKKYLIVDRNGTLVLYPSRAPKVVKKAVDPENKAVKAPKRTKKSAPSIAV